MGVVVELGVGVALELGVPVGLCVAVGVGHPGVEVGVPVGVGPTPFTVTQVENSDVLPSGSVAVAVIT